MRMTGRMASMFHAARGAARLPGFGSPGGNFGQPFTRLSGGLPLGRGGRGRPNSIRNSIGRNFFDRQAVMSQMDRATNRAFARFGYFVMKNARQSIRNRAIRKRGRGKGTNTSLPGQSPTNQQGLLRDNIFFQWDPYVRSVVIGPVPLNSRATVSRGIPQALEYGGITDNRRSGNSQRILPRPYMKPAFDRALQQRLPAFWGAL